MKIIRLAFLLGVFLILPRMNAQDLELSKKDSIVKSSWVFGIGFNAVDDAGSEFSNLFNISDNWNTVPYPSRLSIGRYFENGLGLEAIATYNKYKEGKIIDNAINTEDINYFAIDFRASYDLNKIIGQTGVFDPYVGLGLGYTDANNQGRGTLNTIVGFRVWFNDKIGVDLNSTGKFKINNTNTTNHIQYAAGLVYQFKTKKGLSKKGEEKLAKLEEIETEKQRVQDSITIQQENERKARELAARIEKEKEAAKIAAIEAAKKREEAAKKTAIVNQIKDLGFVYFDLNSSYLTKRDKALLSELVLILKNNPNVVLEISSNTDARGTDAYNQWLSERRLKRTIDFLIKNSISSERLKGEALGETNLTNDCFNGVYCSEKKQKENRRCEFKVVSF